MNTMTDCEKIANATGNNVKSLSLLKETLLSNLNKLGYNPNNATAEYLLNIAMLSLLRSLVSRQKNN